MPMEACSGLWRSEDMVLLSLQMQREVAHDVVLKLGEIGMFQFDDLNRGVSAFQRDFVQEVRRCDDMERKLRMLQEEIGRAGVPVISDGGAEAETMFSLEQKIDEVYGEVMELNQRYQALIEERNRTMEHLEVLQRGFGVVRGDGLAVLAGVIMKDRLATFERLVFRVTRGNSVVRAEEIAKPFYSVNVNAAVHKAVFAVYYSAPRLGERLRRICEVNGATVYPTVAADHGPGEGLEEQLESVTQTLRQSLQRQRQVLMGIASSCYEWRRAVVTERAVFSTLNLLSFSGSTVVAQGWAPVRALEDLRVAVAEAEYMAGAQVSSVMEVLPTKAVPPTYFYTNKITSSFQGIVDGYGMARYKEVNPGVFTIVTFPYLFGIMYGDMGHGLLLVGAAAYLVYHEKRFEGRPLNEIFAMIFGGRYLLLGMGLFAVYMGMLYNDLFGFSVELFRSGYLWPPLPPEGPSGTVYPSSPDGRRTLRPARPVVFGIDAAWAETENKLEFYNSVKMKCSVVVGVVQMVAGVVLSLLNYRYAGDGVKVWCRFFPELLFLVATFGYMCFLIVLKWLTPWGTDPSRAPSLLETMTNFFLAPGTVNLPLFPGQAALQVFLLLLAAACVPWLLFASPYMEKRAYDARRRDRDRRNCTNNSNNDEEEEEEEFQLGEVVIHQIIHTIEYVLGCVSNTASYLRLWALSLAHSQLSEVFWNFAFLLTLGLDSGSGFFVFIGFAVWMAATLGVLLGMESLSAFLHALRLHWVEFNNKFYAADGHPFEPFDLATALSAIR